MSENWHADPGDIARYVAGAIDDTRAGSIEAHLVTCAHCRRQVAQMAEVAKVAKVPGVGGPGRAEDGLGRLDASWRAIVDTLDVPRPTFLERVARRLGLGDHTARVLAATPSLQGSWLLAVVVALGFATLAAQTGTDRGLALFLILAPLIPVVGVAAAFGPGLDPTWEITAAAPRGGFQLLLLRATAVFATTLAVATVAAVALPGLSWTAAGWVLPALALTLASLALSTFTTPERACTAVGVLWMVVVLGSAQQSRDVLAAFGTNGQLCLAAVAAVAAILVAQRRDAFEIRSQL